jgi:hypothetical protein
MGQHESGRSESFWLWTGDAEYQGRLVASGEDRLIARVRFADRWTPGTGAPGMPVPFDLSERQRRLTQRIGFGQSPALCEGALLQFRVTALQPSRDPCFMFVLAGSFTPIADEHLEPLSRLSSNEAFRYLQSCAPQAPGRDRLKSG